MPPLPTATSGDTAAIDMSEEEEVERVTGLLQRESLLRDLGVVDQVYRLLHGRHGMPDSFHPHEQNETFHHRPDRTNKVR